MKDDIGEDLKSPDGRWLVRPPREDLVGVVDLMLGGYVMLWERACAGSVKVGVVVFWMAYGVLEEQMQPLPTAAVSGLETAAERAPPLLHCLEDGEGLRWRQFRGMIFEKQSQCLLECCHRGGNGRRTEEGSA